MSTKYQGSGPWQQINTTRANAPKPSAPSSITTKAQAAAAAASNRSKRAGSQGLGSVQQYVQESWMQQQYA